ncbi:MAG: glycoside hydrolase family 25 protein [Lachnospiraceae bacterium]|nr:glycoside hydrolase family 25 protein [Lachnospiraceae bacterium]
MINTSKLIIELAVIISLAISTPYHFYDVFRHEYEMTINPEITKNSLKKEGFSYIGTDAKGKLLSDIKITDETDLFAEGQQMQGYPGIIKYEDDVYTSRFGIDVSKFQGKIDFNKVKDAGVEFVIVRVGFRGYGKSGSLSEDARYRKNIEGALAAGLDVGVYFYAQAIDEEEAIEEADFVLNLIDGYDLRLPIVYDPEHVLNDDARTDNVSGEQFTKNAMAFCNRISQAGYEPMIYANMLWEAYELDLNKLKDVKVWYADYELLPQSPYKFDMWQYCQAGHISGIDGAVDLNMMLCEKE